MIYPRDAIYFFSTFPSWHEDRLSSEHLIYNIPPAHHTCLLSSHKHTHTDQHTNTGKYTHIHVKRSTHTHTHTRRSYVCFWYFWRGFTRPAVFYVPDDLMDRARNITFGPLNFYNPSRPYLRHLTVTLPFSPVKGTRRLLILRLLRILFIFRKYVYYVRVINVRHV